MHRNFLFIVFVLFPVVALAGPTFVFQQTQYNTKGLPYRPPESPEDHYRAVEERLIREHTPPPEPPDAPTGDKPAASAAPEENPAFGKVGGLGPVGGLGTVGGASAQISVDNVKPK